MNWIPCTKWSKITKEEADGIQQTPPTEGFLREFLHNAGEWFVRYSVKEPTTELWYKDLT